MSRYVVEQTIGEAAMEPPQCRVVDTLQPDRMVTFAGKNAERQAFEYQQQQESARVE